MKKKLISPAVEKRVRQLRKDLQAYRDESIRTRIVGDERHFFAAISELLNADAIALGISNLEICFRNWALLDLSQEKLDATMAKGYAGPVGGGFGLDSTFHCCQRPAGELIVGDLIDAGSFLDEVVAVKLNAKSVRIQTRTGQMLTRYGLNDLKLRLDHNIVRLRRPEERGEIYYRNPSQK